MNHRPQTIQTTKNGTSQTGTNQDTAKAEAISFDGDDTVLTAPGKSEDLKETIEQFYQKVASAQRDGQESIETSDQIIAQFNRTGLGGANYFIYKGIKVFPYGKSDEILANENIQMGQKLHGKSEGTVDNR